MNADSYSISTASGSVKGKKLNSTSHHSSRRRWHFLFKISGVGHIELIRHGQASLGDEDCDQLSPLERCEIPGVGDGGLRGCGRSTRDLAGKISI